MNDIKFQQYVVLGALSNVERMFVPISILQEVTGIQDIMPALLELEHQDMVSLRPGVGGSVGPTTKGLLWYGAYQAASLEVIRRESNP